jgi:cytochrome d ubiquinol oxidase subunit I
VALSLGGFTALYLTLATVEVKLLARYAKAGPAEEEGEPPGPDTEAEGVRPLTFAY